MSNLSINIYLLPTSNFNIPLTRSDMHRWMAAFPSINVAPDEEKIYEDWGENFYNHMNTFSVIRVFHLSSTLK